MSKKVTISVDEWELEQILHWSLLDMAGSAGDTDRTHRNKVKALRVRLKDSQICCVPRKCRFREKKRLPRCMKCSSKPCCVCPCFDQ